jgi:hypothetical protein
MNTQECCNHNCNQGRDCPRRKTEKQSKFQDNNKVDLLDTRSYLIGRYDAIKTDNKPVAWIDPYDLERMPLYDCWVNGEKSKWGDIPLYTLPAEHEELKAAVRSFFQDFIDVREESDSGRVFAPITISSSRCMMTEPLAEVLAKMRKLSGSEK